MAQVKTPSFVEELRTLLVTGLRKAGIPAEVDYELVPTTKLYRFWVVAKKFNRLPPTERQDLVWRLASSILTADEQMRISMIVTLTPEEAGND